MPVQQGLTCSKRKKSSMSVLLVYAHIKRLSPRKAVFQFNHLCAESSERLRQVIHAVQIVCAGREHRLFMRRRWCVYRLDQRDHAERGGIDFNASSAPRCRVADQRDAEYRPV